MFTKEEQQTIQNNHPSICYNCYYSRKPAADANIKKGYVGCALRVFFSTDDGYSKDWDEINEGKEVAEGWVDLQAGVFSEGSGIITNFQLVTLEVVSCNSFEGRTR